MTSHAASPMRADFGSASQAAVERVRLEIPGLALELLTLGAAVRRVEVDGRDVVLGHPDAQTYVDSPFCLGVTIGRFANRIGGARVTIDGTTYILTPSEGPNTLHGGLDGFAKRIWEVTDLAPDSAEFTLTSADGDQGFPGEVVVSVRYTVAPGELRLDYTAATTAPTPINLTNHIYFNPAGEASGSSDDLLLTVPAARVVEVDGSLIPTGRLIDAGEHDLRTPRRVADVAPLDTCFVIDAADGAPVLHATLQSADLAIDVFSDQPGLQIYTAEAMVDVPGLTGRYGPRAGVALETQNLPDAPNQPGFPDSILRPGQVHRTTTVWRFRRLA